MITWRELRRTCRSDTSFFKFKHTQSYLQGVFSERIYIHRKNGTKMSERPSVICYWRMSLLAQAITNSNSLWQNCFQSIIYIPIHDQEWYFPCKGGADCQQLWFQSRNNCSVSDTILAQWEINVGISLANPSCPSSVKERGPGQEMVSEWELG